MSDSSVMSPSDLYAYIYKFCEKAEGGFENSIDQVNFLLSNHIEFTDLYKKQFVPIFSQVMKKAGKSLEQAKFQREFADLYKNVVEPQFMDNAFESLNKAILNVPASERGMLFDLFAQRSNLHHHRLNNQAALADLEHALTIRQSYSCVERKVQILKKLDRCAEAFKYLDDLINSEDFAKFSDGKQDLLKKLRKEFKQYKLEVRVPLVDQTDRPYHLKVDNRVLAVNNPAGRMVFRAVDTIPANTEVLCEEVFSFQPKKTFLATYCNICYKKVENSFWPCDNCNEVVYCSAGCGKKDTRHPLECGLLGLIKANLSTQGPQVYKQLISFGHDQLDELMEEAKELKLEQMFNEAKLGISKYRKVADLEKIFNLSQFQLILRIQSQKPARTAIELANAFYILAIYCYKNKISVEELQKKGQVAKLVSYIATSILRAIVNEYTWNETDSSGDRVQIGHFQCVFGSTVGHGCVPNAEWTFNGSRFSLNTTKQVNKDEEVTITYGVGKEDRDLFSRLTYLAKFYIMCNCDRCITEAKQNFSIRCEHCHGPIPYDYTQLQNQLCLVCEKKFSKPSIMKSIQREMISAKRSLWIVKQLEGDEELANIENMMSTLACYVYLECEQFLSLVRDLCEEYITRKMFGFAVEWYQWFVDGTNIHLSLDKDQLIQLYNLDKWAYCYMKWVEEKSKNEEQVGHNYLETGSHIIKRLFSTLELLNNNTMFDLSMFDQLHSTQIVKQFYANAQDKSYRFKEVCDQLRGVSKKLGYPTQATDHGHSSDTEFGFEETEEEESSSINLQTVE